MSTSPTVPPTRVPAPALPGRGPDLLHHAILEVQRRVDRREGQRHGGHALPEFGPLLLTSGARRQMPLHLPGFIGGEQAEGKLSEALPDLHAAHGDHSSARAASSRAWSCWAFRSLISDVRSLVFTVPSGMPSASAISRAVQPWKYASDRS